MRLGVLGEEGGGLVVAVAVREEEELLYQTMGHAVEKFHLISRGTVVTASALCCLRMFSLCCFVFAWCQSAMWQRAGYVGPNVCLLAVLEVIEHAVRGWLATEYSGHGGDSHAKSTLPPSALLGFQRRTSATMVGFV